MVKRQKEKQYLSAREQREQGRSRSNLSASSAASTGVVQKSLPFKCCALTLVPFETPVCTIVDGTSTNSDGSSNKQNNKYGIVFDNTSLMEFILKHKKDPVTGNPMNSSKIIKLNMDRDSETGEWQCPVLTKAFSDHNTKIVAVISPSGGNEATVYSYEAYHELNAKPKNYVDLTTGLKFSPKKDVILLNDPSNLTFQKNVRDVSTFWHIRNARSKNSGRGASDSIRKSVTATRVMEQIQKARVEKERKQAEAKEKAAEEEAESDGFSYEVPGANLPFRVPTEDVTGVKYSSGEAAGGLTSTAGGTVGSEGDLRTATPDEILESRCRVMASKANKGKKGYVRLIVQIQRRQATSLSSSSRAESTSVVIPLLLELHCDMVPRTCSNFLGLCRKQRYNGAVFHRWIADFMIQGGGEKGKQEIGKNIDDANGIKPKSNGSDSRDVCLWGPEGFKDEFDDRLTHTGEGVLAMANAGPHTNKQQFYITLGKNRPCPHLDRKHSVFGAVVKGLEDFSRALAENVQTDAKDRPYVERTDLRTGETSRISAAVVILATEVLEDPSKKAQEEEDLRLTGLHEARKALDQKRKRMIGGSSTSNHSSGDKKSSKKKRTKGDTMGVGKYLKIFQDKGGNTEDGAFSKTDNRHAIGIDLAPKGSTDLSVLSDIPALGEMVAPAKKKNAKFGDFSSW